MGKLSMDDNLVFGEYLQISYFHPSNIFYLSSTSLIPILDEKLQIESFSPKKKSSRLVYMFLTPERKPSFPIQKVMLDKGEYDNNDVMMNDK
jgi:hypothetical protein